MIIVSQDKDFIINFDNVESVWIDDNILDKTKCTFDIVAGDEIVGSYKTEERAKEVLQEIINRYEKNTYFVKRVDESGHNWNTYGKIYDMPKE